MGAKLADNANVVAAFIDCTAHRDICTKADVSCTDLLIHPPHQPPPPVLHMMWLPPLGAAAGHKDNPRGNIMHAWRAWHA
jgi:hypothetical protein